MNNAHSLQLEYNANARFSSQKINFQFRLIEATVFVNALRDKYQESVCA